MRRLPQQHYAVANTVTRVIPHTIEKFINNFGTTIQLLYYGLCAVATQRLPADGPCI